MLRMNVGVISVKYGTPEHFSVWYAVSQLYQAIKARLI